MGSEVTDSTGDAPEAAEAAAGRAGVSRRSIPPRQPLTLVHPRTWALLLLVVVALLGGGAWALFGRVTMSTVGAGLMMDPSGLREMTVGEEAIVQSIEVERDAPVSEGDVVAKVEPTRLTREIQSLKDRRRELIDRHQKYTGLTTEFQEGEDVGGSFADAREQRLAEIREQAEKLHREIKLLEDKRDARRTLKSPIDGRIFEIHAAEGEDVGGDDVVLTIRPTEWKRDVLVGFIPESAGRPPQGARVLVLPTSSEPADHGYIEGEVRRVSVTPRRRPEILEYLRDPGFVERKLGEGSAYRVEVKLDSDPDSTSGLSWTLGEGPDANRTFVGSHCTIEVITGELSPLQIAFPSLRP